MEWLNTFSTYELYREARGGSQQLNHFSLWVSGLRGHLGSVGQCGVARRSMSIVLPPRPQRGSGTWEVWLGKYPLPSEGLHKYQLGQKAAFVVPQTSKHLANQPRVPSRPRLSLNRSVNALRPKLPADTPYPGRQSMKECWILWQWL